MKNLPVFLVMAEGPDGVIHKSVTICSDRKEVLRQVGKFGGAAGMGFRVYTFNNGCICRVANRLVLRVMKDPKIKFYGTWF